MTIPAPDKTLLPQKILWAPPLSSRYLFSIFFRKPLLALLFLPSASMVSLTTSMAVHVSCRVRCSFLVPGGPPPSSKNVMKMSQKSSPRPPSLQKGSTIYYNFKLINYVFVLNLRKIKYLIFHSDSLKRIKKMIENV